MLSAVIARGGINWVMFRELGAVNPMSERQPDPAEAGGQAREVRQTLHHIVFIPRMAAWCRDQGYGRTDPSPAWGQATRT